MSSSRAKASSISLSRSKLNKFQTSGRPERRKIVFVGLGSFIFSRFSFFNYLEIKKAIKYSAFEIRMFQSFFNPPFCDSFIQSLTITTWEVLLWLLTCFFRNVWHFEWMICFFVTYNSFALSIIKIGIWSYLLLNDKY